MTIYFFILTLDVVFVLLSAVSKQTENVLLFSAVSLSSFVRNVLSEANSGGSAKIRVTRTMAAGGVTVMGPGTLPCSVLVHYSIISQ